MTLDDLQARAYNAAALPMLKTQQVNPDAAIFKYWTQHKDVGVPITGEIALEDGTTAVIFSTGRIVHWLQGDQVEVI
jgi:hypothetical protein